jgi:hypothetical protein
MDPSRPRDETQISAFTLCCLVILAARSDGFSQEARSKDKESPRHSTGSPRGYILEPISGADGNFELARVKERKTFRSLKNTTGDYSLYMYFRVPDGTPKNKGAVYLEVEYLDVGTGRLSLQYNASNAEDYRQAEAGHGVQLAHRGAVRTAVFELARPDFRQAQNLRTDMRLCAPGGTVQLHVFSATLFLEPTESFKKKNARPWLDPYRGPTRNDIDATTLYKKVLCGYQGWFGCPGDDADRGWVHWGRNPGRIAPETLTVDMWPDMTEYTDEEKYPVPGFTQADGRQAHLFSSSNSLSVERHFQWMAKYGIDGVFVQRFVVGLKDPPGASRVLGYARNAANRTGRVFSITYDMTGTPPAQVYDLMTHDWKWLVDEMKIPSDRRYLHHAGKPVLHIFGFFSDRFGAQLAHQIIDFFKNDRKYGATLVGGVQWYWRRERDPEWARAFRRFDVLSPWNVGNLTGDGGKQIAATDQWKEDVMEAKKAGVLFMPVIYPGFSWDNLTRKEPGKTNVPRLGGEFYWLQFSTVAGMGLDMAYVAMFDEVDEGTAILPVTNTPPQQGHFVTYEGKPSDWYLRLTGEGSRLIRKERPNTKTIPIRP